jgi:hypothetical protein
MGLFFLIFFFVSFFLLLLLFFVMDQMNCFADIEVFWSGSFVYLFFPSIYCQPILYRI